MLTTRLASASAFALASLVATGALAQSSASDPCGGIRLDDIGECHFEFDGGCEASCEPLAFRAACEGRCDASITSECSATCGASCVAACEADPGRFDCRASCTADCQANARAECGTDQECISYFEAQCSSSCEAECDLVAPSADCEAQCQGCCGGSCTVEANFDCELGCTAEMEGGCQVDCRQPEGALFCDGQYLPVVDLPACIAWLAENFEIRVEAEVSAEGFISCAAAPNSSLTDGSAIYAGLLGLGLVFARRRRQTRSA